MRDNAGTSRVMKTGMDDAWGSCMSHEKESDTMELLLLTGSKPILHKVNQEDGR